MNKIYKANVNEYPYLTEDKKKKIIKRLMPEEGKVYDLDKVRLDLFESYATRQGQVDSGWMFEFHEGYHHAFNRLREIYALLIKECIDRQIDKREN